MIKRLLGIVVAIGIVALMLLCILHRDEYRSLLLFQTPTPTEQPDAILAPSIADSVVIAPATTMHN